VGDLPGGTFESYGGYISGDGMTVVGWSYSTRIEPFSWNTFDAIQGLGWLTHGGVGSQARAYAASADGSIVVGCDSCNFLPEAFIWDSINGMRGIGDLPGGNDYSIAFDVSSDGSVVVGRSQSTAGTEAFIWDAINGMQGLGDLSGSSFYSTAWGVSADGTIVVGQGTGDSGTQAFVWDGTNGMDGLGDLPGGSFNSSAQAVSADGSIIVGWGRSEPGKEAFVWDSVNGMRGLGDLSGGVFDSVAYGVSRDGSRIVGTGKSDSGSEAFIWDEVNGMRSLKDILTDLGLDLTGWSLWDAYRISDDGKTIAGRGQNPDGNSEAWIAYLGSAPEISLSAAINNLNYETDPDADGYYDTFSFDISLDFNIVSGPANVFVQITSTATGQSWWSADPINLSSGSAANSATFNFDQTDFQDRFSGNIGLNFSVKIWDQSKKQIF